MSKIIPILIIFGITIGIYFLSKNPLIRPYYIHLAIISFLILIIYSYFLRKKRESLTEARLFVYQITIFILLLVASTGWFFSPFFLTLYICAIFLAFSLSPSVLFGFIFSLVVVYSFNLNQSDQIYASLVFATLLTAIPVSYYLRREYLKFKETNKEIIVLKKEKMNCESKLEEVLSNKIINFSALMREPICDIKQLSLHMEDLDNKQDLEKCRQRILKSSQRLLTILDDFEEENTGRKLLTTA